MKARVGLIVLTSLCFVASPLRAEEPKDLLFIGNSFTVGIPSLVADLAIDAGWLTPNSVQRSVSGQPLEYHRGNTTTVNMVDAGGWDFVVLQEFSTRPIDDIGPDLADPAKFKEDATWFYDRIKSASPAAQVVLYETWARHENHSIYNTYFGGSRTEMQNQLSSHYHDAAANYIPTNATSAVKTDVFVAHVGDAWQQNFVNGGPKLHGGDNYHAGPLGAYLNALVLYGSIYQRSTQGLAPVNGITAAEAQLLQDLADGVTGYTTVGAESGTPKANGVMHGSFEGPAQANDSAFTNRIVDGWMIRNANTNGIAVRNSSNTHFANTSKLSGVDRELPDSGDGFQFLWVNSGYAMQYLADTLEANKQYQLIVALGRDLDVNHQDVDYAIRLYAGDTLLDEQTGFTSEIARGTFVDQLLEFTTGDTVDPGQRLRIEIGRNGGSHVNSNLAFDNVRLLITDVPEPAGLAVIGCGGLVLLRRRSR